ncbi:MAG: metal-dependent hydrolase [Candidatus Heimdallarchaeaceae archaeon]
MHRKGHLIGATIFWLVAIVLYYVLGNYTALSFTSKHSMWIVLSFLVCHFGAQLPDYDLLTEKFLPHRNVITHSVFLPLLICIPIFFVNSETKYLVPIFAMYLVGHTSHLFLDLFPKKWEGTALIHIWWRNEEGKKTFSSKASRNFLVFNGLIIMVAGIILLYFFNSWIS